MEGEKGKNWDNCNGINKIFFKKLFVDYIGNKYTSIIIIAICKTNYY